jgi:hypothetical protein
MNDRLFPEFDFVTLTEHVVDADLISLDPITTRCVDAEAFLLLDPLAQAVSFQESYPSVRSQPKSYPWLLNARQVHIPVLLVVPIEDIAQEFLEEIVTADFSNGAGSLKIGWFGMLALETASEGTEDVIVIGNIDLRLTLNPCCIPLSVELLIVTEDLRSLIVDLLIQMVVDPALDILPRSSRACLKAVVPLGYAEVLDRCGGGSIVPERGRVVSRTTRVVVKDEQAIHVVLVVMSPDVDIATERA